MEKETQSPQLPQMAVVRCYLFSFTYWKDSPPQYILVYAESEEKARIIGVNQLRYNSGDKPQPNALNLRTFGL